MARKTETLIRLTPEVKLFLQQLAEKKGQSLSDTVARLILQEINNTEVNENV